MSPGEIIILAVYAIGYLLTFFHQKKRIDTLKTQVDSQSGTLDLMQKFMSIFKLDEVEKYVKLIEKKAILEKEEEKEKLEEEWKVKVEEMKKLKEKLVSEGKETTKIMGDDLFEVVTALGKASIYLADNPYFEKVINEMKDGIMKEIMLKRVDDDKKKLEAQRKSRSEIMTMLLQNPAIMERAVQEWEQKISGKKKS